MFLAVARNILQTAGTIILPLKNLVFKLSGDAMEK